MNVKIDIQDLKYMLDNTPASQNIMLTGRHGIGKSEILTNYFAKKGMKVVALFLGQMSDPGDLIGLPDKSGEKTVFRPPYWFPLDGKPIVLFLDELNRARPEVLQTIMDLALNRKLAGRDLPEGSRVIAAVNEGEEYQLTDLDPALVSRFNVFRFEPSVQEWILWAKKNDLDPRVIGFISENAQWLDKDPNAEEGADTGLDKTPDRRAWKRVSDVIKPIPKLESRDIKLISSIIGVKATNLFVTKMAQIKQVDIKDLLKDFSKYGPQLVTFKPHDFVVINEDIFQYLEANTFSDSDSKTIAKNIIDYIDFLEVQKKRETFASFANMFIQDIYKNGQKFIFQYCPSIAQKLFMYTSQIK
ncbi:AAA family ATPase [Xylanibacter brevis]|uniref:AAA family ATPase n=1 Tax=Xylanibacter brevis TaxID=83231 RepID=UPI0004867EFE|nr:AAA family ATPase [Xylanibacter brevis]